MRMINKIAADTMIYAFHAESRDTDRQNEFALDELEEVMTFNASPLYAGVIHHWSQRLISPAKSGQP